MKKIILALALFVLVGCGESTDEKRYNFVNTLGNKIVFQLKEGIVLNDRQSDYFITHKDECNLFFIRVGTNTRSMIEITTLKKFKLPFVKKRINNEKEYLYRTR